MSPTGMNEHRTCSVELFCSVLFCRTQNRTEHQDKISNRTQNRTEHQFLFFKKYLCASCALCGWNGKNISRHFVNIADFADVAYFPYGVRSKVDGPNDLKWTVLSRSGRSKRIKVDGPKGKDCTIWSHESGRPQSMKVDGPRGWNWTVLKNLRERSKRRKMDGLVRSN